MAVINLRLILAITIGKVTSFFLERFGSGGTAAPGLIALKIYPQLIKKLACQLEKNILITGTNGKTTTARMTANILKEANVKVIHNRTGSNLLRGIASTLIKNASLLGKLPKDYFGLWETDEAAFSLAVTETKPKLVLITNLFRDQLDRYGEIDTLATKWQKALKRLPKDSIIILNADDATVASLGNFTPGVKTSRHSGNDQKKILYFGLADKKLGGKQPDHASDATVCPYCFSNLNYQTCFVGHMGIYSCSKCGPIQPKKDVYPPSFTTTLPGTYNLYNFTAATALGLALKIPKNIIIKGLTSFTPAFGRVEKIKTDNKILNIFLVKNPTGFNEVIDTLLDTRCYQPFPTPGVGKTCLIAINDLVADGTDVSWLWDVNFEKLIPKLKKVIVSGIRAHDMALRLKYTNTTRQQLNNLTIEPNLKKAINKFLTQKQKELYILPTYTAMLETRKILNQMGLVHSSWED